MSSMLAPGVRETTDTTGTGTLTLAPVTGSVEFSKAFADGTRVCYAIKNGNNWEWGIGTVGANKTLARTIPLVTFVGGVFDKTSPTAISLVGTSEVFCSGAHNSWMNGPTGIVSNTVLGLSAGGSAGTTGGNNTAVGYSAQNVLTTALYGCAVGSYAQYSLTTGNNNIAVGYSSQRNLSTGGNNTAVGHATQNALTTSNYSCAVGSYAQYSLTTGNNNTAVGYYAQYSLSTGNNNLSMGINSGKNIESGSGNITIGGMNSAGNYVPVFDITTQSNVISLGSTAVTAAHINVAWTVVSDERDKTCVEALPYGLDIIESLRPVSYQRRTARGEGGDGIARYGFVAQEVLAIEGAAPIVDQADPDRLGLNSDYIIPVLVRAVQQLAARLKVLEEMIDG